MYTEFYRLSGMPFQLTPDNRFFFDSSVHSRAIAHLVYGLSQQEGFVIITGEVGAGKTTLVEQLWARLDHQTYVIARIATTQVSGDDLLRLAAAGFGLPDENPDKASLLRNLEQLFREHRAAGRRCLLVVDEVQNLSFAALEELRMLSNITIDGHASLQTILLGQPQFRHTLASPDLDQLRQRVLAAHHLGPLSEAETREYILHRLRKTGWTDNPEFDEAAFAALYRRTGGVPRRINTLCSRVLLYGALEGSTRITDEIVDDTANDLQRDLGTVTETGGVRAKDRLRDGTAEHHPSVAAPHPGARGRRCPPGTHLSPPARPAVLLLRAAKPGRTPGMRAPGSVVVRNAMTVDVEDYFQVQAFAQSISRADWDEMPRRVEANTDRILAQFERAGVTGTFFTLGWVAERHPALVRRIVAAGHELASHGYDHTRADAQDPPTFAADVRKAKRILEDTGGCAVVGYRAATFSIGRPNQWAFGVLAEQGYRYSSSVYPVKHDLYGMPEAPRVPFRPGAGPLWEIPMTTVRLLGRNLPCSGGGYFRLAPYALFRRGLGRVNRREGRPGIFYTHPWEIDPDQPRVADCGRMSRFRHYVNLGKTAARLDRLLRDFAWDRLDRVYAELLGSRAEPVG